MNLWARWSFVRRRDTGEFLKTWDSWVLIHVGNGYKGRTSDLPSPSLLVQAFGVTPFDDLQRGVNKNFYKFQR